MDNTIEKTLQNASVPDSESGNFDMRKNENDGGRSVVKQEIYDATANSAIDLTEKFDYFSELLQNFKDGISKVELKKRFMLKAIDEVWVNAIEDTIPSIDVIIRTPGVLLQETESVLPMEQTRRVTSRSVQHLCQHTDLINEIKDDGTVMPSKLLNVFQDETIFTYENKFINTLLLHLYGFVLRRYESAKQNGEDEKYTKLDLLQQFEKDDVNTKIHLTIEVSEPPRSKEVLKNYIYTTDLWKRVEKIYKIVTGYMDSKFVQQMGKAYVHPPIMRTNKLLKNVDFRKCLALWEFMESYDNTGFETLIQEDLENVDELCIRDFFNTIQMQYVLFQKHIQNEFVEENALDSQQSDDPLKPKIVEELDPLNEREFDQTDLVPDAKPEITPTQTGEEDLLEEAILIALDADDLYMREEEDDEEEVLIVNGEIVRKFRHSFLSRLIRAQIPAQDFYTQIKNEILSYKKIKSRISWKHDLFTSGRKKCAKINVKGKTLYLYLPLDPNAFETSKYHHIDVSNQKANADFPFLLKIRSERALKYAKELVALVMERFSISRLVNPIVTDWHFEPDSTENLVARGLIRVIGENYPPFTPIDTFSGEFVPEKEESTEESTLDISYRYKYSFLSRLILAQNPAQDFYTEVKNELLSYKKVKARVSWNHEAYSVGRKKCAIINVKGKSLYLYLPLNPNDFDSNKYHQRDVSDVKKYAEYPFLLRVKSNRAVKYAKELIAIVMASLAIARLDIPVYSDYHLDFMSAEEMTKLSPPLVKIVGENNEAFAPLSQTASEEVLETVTETAETEEPSETVAENTSATDETVESDETSEVEVTEDSDSDEGEQFVQNGIVYRYKYSFTARLIRAQNSAQDFYTEVKNYLLSYKKVKSRVSWNYETFNSGRKKCAIINVKGKSLYLYLPLNPNDFDSNKYHHRDVSDVKKYAEYPFLLRVKSDRAVKYAKELISIVMQSFALVPLSEPVWLDYHLENESLEDLLSRDLVRLVAFDKDAFTPSLPPFAEGAENGEKEEIVPVSAEEIGEAEEISFANETVEIQTDDAEEQFETAEIQVENAEGKNETVETDTVSDSTEAPKGEVLSPIENQIFYRYRLSFMAKLIQGQDPVQDYYTVVKNCFDCYNAKGQISWDHETLHVGRENIAKLRIRGKALLLYLAISPSYFDDTKYRVKDVSNEPSNSAFPTLLKIHSSRTVKYAKELIDFLMDEYGFKKTVVPFVDYHLPFQTTEQLLAHKKPLVKAVVASVGTRWTDNIRASVQAKSSADNDDGFDKDEE